MKLYQHIPQKPIIALVALLALGAELGPAQQPVAPNAPSSRSKTQTIEGQVRDEHGGGISDATVVLTDPQKHEHPLKGDRQGRYSYTALEPGKYGLRISAKSYAAYENPGIELAPGQTAVYNVTLQLLFRREITVTALSGDSLLRSGEYGGSNVILRGAALEALPDFPGGMETMLRALSLRTPGPFLPPILVNGFENNPLPSKESISEIRINDNPFSAEYPQLGLGRIEILTKPGTDQVHGGLFATLGDGTFNSRNPFATNDAPYQARLYGGDFSGPLVAKRANFFVDFSRAKDRGNALINATILDPSFKVIPLAQGVVTPDLQRSFGPRMDFLLNPTNTLVVRYSDQRTGTPVSGIGGFSLSSRSQNATTAVQAAQVTETAVLGPNTLAETKFQLVRTRAWQSGNNSIPVINVPGSFTGGGADISVAYDLDNRAELHHAITWELGRHVLKLGVDAARLSRTNGSTQNFGGTYTFSGGLAPELNSLNQIVLNSGVPVQIPISGLEQYRRTVLFRSQGMSPQAIRNLGGGASQFSLTSGQVEAGLRQYQAAGFVQDDWRLSPKFSLNMGLRWEYQNDIGDQTDFAPRLGFAWGLGGGKNASKTVLRGGAGIFYNRVGDDLVLRALQLNGVFQRQIFTTDSAVLNLFPAVPSSSLLTGFAVPQSIVQLDGNIRAPYTMQSSLGIERDLGHGFSLAATYGRIRSLHMLRSRDINAPLPGGSIRPFAAPGDIFDYESSGVYDQQQFQTNLIFRTGKSLALWTTYTWSDAKSDTDGPDTFPANSYDLRSEYGRSALDARHTVYFGGWISLKGGIDVTPLVIWRSGLPYNITTGLDNNRDSLFTDRPAFATGLTRPSVVMTTLGPLDFNPIAGQQIVPRNFGQGPNFFVSNLRIGKRIKLGERLNMQVAVQGTNIFNHTNPGLPVGILSSRLFGISNSSAGDWGQGSNQAGNRRLEFGLYVRY